MVGVSYTRDYMHLSSLQDSLVQEGSLDLDSAHLLTQQLSERQVGVARDLASRKEQQFRLLRERVVARKEERKRRVVERQEKKRKQVSDSRNFFNSNPKQQNFFNYQLKNFC